LYRGQDLSSCQIAADYVDLFEKIISAYKLIAETLPRFDRLSEAFKESEDFKQVVAVFYADIIRFHKEAYKLVKRNGNLHEHSVEQSADTRQNGGSSSALRGEDFSAALKAFLRT
jgi:hypothetical protein